MQMVRKTTEMVLVQIVNHYGLVSTNQRPTALFFCDRDGIKKYDISEIGYERRNSYSATMEV